MPLTTLEAASIEGCSGKAARGSSTNSFNPPSDAGWRWRRELCLTERSQQCQSGPTTKAWRRLPARHRHDACETPSEHLRGAVPKLERNACQRGNVGRMRGIVRGTCGEHCRSCMEMGGACGWHRQARACCTAGKTREWTALFPKTCGQHRLEARRSLRRSECGWHRQTALSELVRVAPPGTPGTCADSPIEAGPSYRSCTASPQRRRGVTVSSLIETLCEL